MITNPFEILDQRLSNVESILLDLKGEQLQRSKKHSYDNSGEQLIPRHKAAEMLDVDLSTLHNWQKKGLLVPLGLGGRVYYKKSDIEKALQPLK